jgi:putative spermidine/putrescine transport system permease protein
VTAGVSQARGGRRSGNRSLWTIALRIQTALVFAFLMLPLLIVFPISFSSSPYLRFPPPGLSLRWYQAYLHDPVWIDATLRSLKIATVTTALATLLGTLLAFSIVRGRYWGRDAVNQLAALPIIVPTIV